MADDPYRSAVAMRPPERTSTKPPSMLTRIGGALLRWFTGTNSRTAARQRALAALDTLPFRIVIAPELVAADDVYRRYVYIRSVTIRLGRSPSSELERLARDAQRVVPSLSISSESETMLELGWPDRDGKDFEELVALLTTWGRDLHTDHIILEVYVAA